jgi:microcystin-dependent protein
MRKDGVQSNGGVLYMKTKGVTFSTGWLDLATASGATAVLPPGAITAFGGGAAPDGWLLCDGAAVSRTVYSLLFTAIGTTYGAGDGTSTFNVPNLKGKVMAGYDSAEAEFNALGKAAGEKTHTLTASEMPSHGHGVNDPGHSHSYTNPGNNLGTGSEGGVSGPNHGDNTGGSSTGISIQSAGGNGAHNNLQPYLVVNHIIKT